MENLIQSIEISKTKEGIIKSSKNKNVAAIINIKLNGLTIWNVHVIKNPNKSDDTDEYFLKQTNSFISDGKWINMNNVSFSEKLTQEIIDILTTKKIL